MSKKTMPDKGARRGAFSGEEIEARVRKHYEEGKRLLEQSTKTGANQAKPESEDVPIRAEGSERVYQNEYRRFAHVYSPRELEELLKLRTEKQGTPLGWGIVRKLMAVPDRTLRRKLELRAANESWTVKQADAIVRDRVFKKKRSNGARPIGKPKNLIELLQRLEMHTGESRRRLSHWTESDLLNQTNSTKKVGESLRGRALAIRKEMMEVASMTKALSKKLDSIVGVCPELGKVTPDRAVETPSTKKPG